MNVPATVRSQSFWQKVRILLIEDERPIRELLTRMLNKVGITEITDVRSGEAAWEALVGKERQAFHLIIADLYLPGVSGAAFIKAFRALPFEFAKALPIIVLTGDDRPETFKALEPYHIAKYLVKPVSPALLLEAIERALGLSVKSVPPPLREARLSNEVRHTETAASGKAERSAIPKKSGN